MSIVFGDTTSLEHADKDKKDELKPVVCPRCGYISSPTEKFCSRCGSLLDEAELIKQQIRGKELAKEFSSKALEDPRFFEEIKRLIEMFEIFEKNRDLIIKILQ